MYVCIYIQPYTNRESLSISVEAGLHLSAEDLEHGFSTSFTLLHLRLTGDQKVGDPQAIKLNTIQQNSSKFNKHYKG
jgi:hypothetical protein